LAVFGLIIWQASRDAIQIDPIQVPESLVKAGYTPEVLAQRIMDYMLEVRRTAKTTAAKRQVGFADTGADIVVPGVGSSIGAITNYVRDLMGNPRTRVRGEVTEQDGALYLRLRIDGTGEIAAPDGVALQQLDSVLRVGAQEIERATEPYILAAYLYTAHR